MSLPPDIEASLRERLKVLLSETDQKSQSVRAIAQKFCALPMLADAGGMHLLNLQGDVLEVLWDRPAVATIEVNPRLRRAALFQGSRKYPEIVSLLPQRPNDAIDCPNCDGTGVPKGWA